MKKHVLIALVLLLVGACGQKTNNAEKEQVKVSPEEQELLNYANKIPEFKIKDNDPKNTDPAILFCYSDNLFNSNRKDDAVFWYYLAQYRVFYYARCIKNDEFLENDFVTKVYNVTGLMNKSVRVMGNINRNVFYKAVMDGLSQKINMYGFGNIDDMVSMVDKVIAYEQQNPMNLEALVSPESLIPVEERAPKNEEVKKGLDMLKEYITKNREYLENQRIEQGLENRK